MVHRTEGDYGDIPAAIFSLLMTVSVQHRDEILRHLVCLEEAVGFEARIAEVSSLAAVLAVGCGEGVGVGSFDRQIVLPKTSLRVANRGRRDRPACDRWPARRAMGRPTRLALGMHG